MKDWSGRISNLHISEKSHPELYAELNGMKGKERAERLRTLATSSLINSGKSSTPLFSENHTSGNDNTTPERSEEMDNLGDKIKNAFGIV